MAVGESSGALCERGRGVEGPPSIHHRVNKRGNRLKEAPQASEIRPMPMEKAIRFCSWSQAAGSSWYSFLDMDEPEPPIGFIVHEEELPQGRGGSGLAPAAPA